ncbi:MAG: hypothetical protein GQ580_00605, partial [Candidatus Thorarchaeota archaeon]|nr:hypothetical protein [Candidatus Thorarchaeota archaeon]
MATTRYPTYEGNKSTEKPVRLDKTEGHVVIEGRAYPAREIIEALAQSGYTELRSVGDALVLGRHRITPIFKSAKDRAMASLCHGSLAFCCPLSKRCAERDRALEVLGLTIEEYENLKGDAHYRFIDAARGLSSTDEVQPYDVRGSTANRPAVDRGYGSDEYRRDFDRRDGAHNRRDVESASRRDYGSYRSSSHSDPYSALTTAIPYSEGHRKDSLMDEMRSGSCDVSTQSSCGCRTDEAVE